jgi:hypothetical protein
MALKIIGAGLHRTGTLSLKIALETLGYQKCYHFIELGANPSHLSQWMAASEGQTTDWDALFEGYQATLDFPGQYFYKDLHKAYPNAKVILTVREAERWYESVYNTIYRVYKNADALMPPERKLLAPLDHLLFEVYYQGRFEDKSFMLDFYHQYVEEVKNAIPADKLLVFQVKEGWKPLCEFLDAPIPENEAFPHVNDTQDFNGFYGGV